MLCISLPVVGICMELLSSSRVPECPSLTKNGRILYVLQSDKQTPLQSKRTKQTKSYMYVIGHQKVQSILHGLALKQCPANCSLQGLSLLDTRGSSPSNCISRDLFSDHASEPHKRTDSTTA